MEIVQFSEKEKIAFDIFSEACDHEEKGNITEAMELFKKAAKLGCSSSLINLGNIYDDVIDPPDRVRAVACYKSAVALGSYTGAWNMAIHHRNLGKDRWYRYWLKIAADMGDEDAIELHRSFQKTS